MPRRETLQKRRQVARLISKERGGAALGYYLDAARCSARHGASPENYLVLRFFGVPEAQRGSYLTSGRSKAVDAALNCRATAADKAVVGHKEAFDRAFAHLCRRDFLYAPEAEDAALFRFLAAHETVFLKPRALTMGEGIRRVDTASIEDRVAFVADCREKRLLLEEAIVQHPALAALNPSSVNTVRIVSARDRRGEVRMIGAALRCGGAGSPVDNFHGGGVAYTIDLATGKILTPGRDNSTLAEYVCHPSTGAAVVGLAIPHWGKALALAGQGMDIVPSIGYIGWDMAVTPDGVELIEGNYNWPGGNIIQFDGVGKYPAVLECLR